MMNDEIEFYSKLMYELGRKLYGNVTKSNGQSILLFLVLRAKLDAYNFVNEK